MRLYRIMLVDDEAEVRESIIRKIDWEAAGFEMAGDAENGVDALEKVELFEPDIVLTDIRMPYMDGLELARRIHLMYPSIKLVIFSGFDEFDYAKQAMQSGVIEYILKPVNVDELTRILYKIRQTLDDELRRRRNVEALRESFLKNLPILREHLLYDLTHGGVTEPAKLPALMREYGLDIAEAESWAVAQIVIDRPPESSPLSGESELIPLSVMRILEDMLGKRTKFASFRSSMGICVVAAVSLEATLDSVIAVMSNVCRECKRAFELTVTVGIGQPVQKLTELAPSYREASEAAGFKAVQGAGSAIYIGDVERAYKPVPAIDKRSENELIAAIKFGEDAEIAAAMREIVSGLESARPHLNQLQFYTVGLMNSLLQLAGSYELDISDILSDIFGPQTDFWASLSQIKGIEGLHNWLLELSSRLGKRIHEGRSNNARSVVEEAKAFIAENYTDADFSLEAVCATLHISAAYFSTVFKRETGQSYINYLTGLRLEKAVELLKHTDDKTYLIAEKTGYSDPNYFSYVFKKRYGVSPTKYRSAIQSGAL